MVNRNQSRKLYAQLFDRIRKYIIDNSLSAGDKLPTEHEMCDMFGVSRNPLREAVKTLEIMGMVKSRPGVGIVIQEYNMDFLFNTLFCSYASNSKKLVHEMLDVREVLELGFVKDSFDTLTSDDISELRKILRLMELKYVSGDIFHEEDRQFHLQLYKNVNNGTLCSILSAVWDIDSNFNIEKKKMHLKCLNTHEDIVNALEKKDYELYETCMRSHFNDESYLIGKGYKE